MAFTSLAFIGGGNMASAIISGLVRQGQDPRRVTVVEPSHEQAERLRRAYGVVAIHEAGPTLQDAQLVVWAVKPQQFREAVTPCRDHTLRALHLSVMAGVRLESIARAVNTPRVVRAMPNTPALIGKGVIGLHAPEAVKADEREHLGALLQPMGSLVWVLEEADLDSVTALSGSGPAYVFYFLEAMQNAALDMGLSAAQGRELALGTFLGASALAQQSQEEFAALREKVTSKGGTTAAALAIMESHLLKDSFVEAMQAARSRAQALGDELAG